MKSIVAKIEIEIAWLRSRQKTVQGLFDAGVKVGTDDAENQAYLKEQAAIFQAKAEALEWVLAQ